MPFNLLPRLGTNALSNQISELPLQLLPYRVHYNVAAGSKKTSLFTYIHCVAYYNNRDLVKLKNNGFKILL